MGYDVERFVGYVNKGLLCCVCRDVLEEPLQAPCEHAFCSSCIHTWLIHHQTCPEDRLPLKPSDLHPLYRYMRNDLERLQVRCSYYVQGCDVIGALESIHQHELQCDYTLYSCNSSGRTEQGSLTPLETQQSRMCSTACGYKRTPSEHPQYSCTAEMQTELDLLRVEFDCKVEEVRREMESRLDSQRRYMVQKENSLKNEVDKLKSELTRVMSEQRVLLGAERARRQELERSEHEKAKLLAYIKKEGLRSATLPSDDQPSRSGPSLYNLNKNNEAPVT